MRDDSGGEPVVLTADDGYELGASRFAPRGRADLALVVAGATGVPQRFYRRFAAHARDRGFDALTFDYRGVGASAPPRLRGFEMDHLDWARLDLAAAVAHMARADRALVLVGHSFGGQAFGLSPNADRVAALYTFGTGAGWHGHMPGLERVKVQAMWHVVGPVIVGLTGAMRWSLLGMGEDLPKGVYTKWKRWCARPRHFFDDPEMADVVTSFARITQPIVAANALDDVWAPAASRDAFMSGYANAPWRGIDIDPAASTTGHIGHMGYFRPAARALWDPALDWLREKAWASG